MGNHRKSSSVARRFRFPFHVHISTLFFLLVLAVGASIAWVSYSRSAHMLERAAGDLLVRISRQTVVETEILLSPVGTAVRLGVGPAAGGPGDRLSPNVARGWPACARR